MSRASPEPVTTSSTTAQSAVTPTLLMNGMITSQSRDAAEHSPPLCNAAATAESTCQTGDVIKWSLSGALDDDTAAQQNDISSAAVNNR